MYFKINLKESLRNCCCGPFSPWPWSMGPLTSLLLCPVDSYHSCSSWLWGVPKWPSWYLYPREASVPHSLTWFSTAPVTTYSTWLHWLLGNFKRLFHNQVLIIFFILVSDKQKVNKIYLYKRCFDSCNDVMDDVHVIQSVKRS